MELLALVAKMEMEKKKMEELTNLDEDWISILITERDEQCESKKRCMQQLEECKQKIKVMEDERALVEMQSGTTKNENNVIEDRDNLKIATKEDAQISTTEKPDEVCEETTRIQDNTKGTTTGKLINADSGLEIDFINDIKHELHQSMETMIDEKIGKITTDIKKSCSSFNSFTTRTINIAETGRTRDQNIIIHGINEGNRDDREYIRKLFDILQMDHTGPLMVHRLGIKNRNKQRPLHVTMKTIEEKGELMSRLGLLRGAEDEFKKISVTEDYTVAEREEIKRWVTMANEKTKDETLGYVWKVRGSPKTGMRLIRIKQF